MSWRKNDKSRTPSILCEGGLCVCVCKSAALTGRQLVDVGSHAISSRPWSGYLSLPTSRSGNESSSFAMDQRTPTARLASGKRIPHRFGYLFPTNSRMDHQQYGILPIWHHAQMTSSPPKPRAKKTPNTTRQASAQFSLCNRLQPTPNVGSPHRDIIQKRPEQPLSLRACAAFARSSNFFSRPVDGAAGPLERTCGNGEDWLVQKEKGRGVEHGVRWRFLLSFPRCLLQGLGA